MKPDRHTVRQVYVEIMEYTKETNRPPKTTNLKAGRSTLRELARSGFLHQGESHQGETMINAWTIPKWKPKALFLWLWILATRKVQQLTRRLKRCLKK